MEIRGYRKTRIGIKVWIYKGEVLNKQKKA